MNGYGNSGMTTLGGSPNFLNGSAANSPYASEYSPPLFYLIQPQNRVHSDMKYILNIRIALITDTPRKRTDQNIIVISVAVVIHRAFLMCVIEAFVTLLLEAT